MENRKLSELMIDSYFMSVAADKIETYSTISLNGVSCQGGVANVA